MFTIFLPLSIVAITFFPSWFVEHWEYCLAAKIDYLKDGPDEYGQRPLFIAAMLGRANMVSALIEKDVDIHALTNTSQPYQSTPLNIPTCGPAYITPLHGATAFHAAAMCLADGGYECSAILYGQLDSANIHNALGQTPIHLAAAMGNLKTLKLFGKKEAEAFKALDVSNHNVFYTAILHGSAPVVEYLLNAFPELIHNPYEIYTPHQLAAMHGHPSVIYVLNTDLSLRKDIDSVARAGFTPHFIATQRANETTNGPATQRYFEVAEALISSGQVNKRCLRG